MKRFLLIKVGITIICALVLMLTPMIISKINKHREFEREYQNLTIEKFFDLNRDEIIFLKYNIDNEENKIEDENNLISNTCNTITFTDLDNKSFDWFYNYSHINFYKSETSNSLEHAFLIKDINVFGIYYGYHELITSIDCIRYYSISSEDTNKLYNAYESIIQNWIQNNAN